jgi:hypothetical protein
VTEELGAKIATRLGITQENADSETDGAGGYRHDELISAAHCGVSRALP